MRNDHSLCACGSGLRGVRCCALDLSMLPPPEAARPLIPVVERAEELHRQNNRAEAGKLCREAPTKSFQNLKSGIWHSVQVTRWTSRSR